MKNIDKKIIRAYLWQEVIRLGFCPSGEKEQKKWLHQYLKSLKDFFELNSSPAPPKSNHKIEFSYSISIGLDIKGSITKRDKFMIAFFYLPSSDKGELMWDHDVDGTYFTFPVQEFLTRHNQRNPALREFSDEDIKVVLDGLIFHPAAHQHIKSPIDKHEIRIGGGIGNAFLFLFHLRYQFCPFDDKRKAERKRLVELFKNAVRENSQLAASELMAQP
jgi:hypothetical protein